MDFTVAFDYEFLGDIFEQTFPSCWDSTSAMDALSQDASRRQLERATRRSDRLKLLHRITSSNVSLLRETADGLLTLALFKPINPSDLPLLSECVLQKLENMRIYGAKSFTQSTREWLHMQMRWIIWTLASWERRQPNRFLEVALTVDNVCQALHYRYALYSRQIEGSPFQTASCLNNSAARHFSVRGSMSPLQRCADIAQLMWPMVVCFSQASITDSTCDNAKPQNQVTDGWWWVAVELDTELSDLVLKGRLRDGCKLVILNGVFEAADRGCILRLRSNSVRRASDHARLGYVPPRKLLSGLALSGITASGGLVFGTQVQVVHACLPMSRLTHPYIAVLDSHESQALNSAIDRERHTLLDKIRGDPDMQMVALLENMGCEKWIIEVCVTLEAGGQVQLREDQEREIQRVHHKASIEGQVTMERLHKERSAMLEINLVSYQDILVQCCSSQALAWVRWEGTEADASQGETLSSGKCIFLSNLRPVQSRCQLPLLIYSSNSTTRLMPKSSLEPPVVRWPLAFQPHSTLRALLCTLEGAAQHGVGIETSCIGRIVHWFAHEQDSAASAPRSTAANSAMHIDILIRDDSFVLVLLKYTVPKSIMSRLLWLHAGQEVTVHLGLVERADSENEIITLRRFDRTRVTPVGPLLCLPAPVVRRESFKLGNRRNSGSHPAPLQADKPQNDDTTPPKSFADENELRRFTALLHNKTYYCRTESTTCIESCKRERLLNVTVTLIPEPYMEKQNPLRRYVAVYSPTDGQVYAMRVDSRLHSALVNEGESCICDIVFSRVFDVAENTFHGLGGSIKGASDSAFDHASFLTRPLPGSEICSLDYCIIHITRKTAAFSAENLLQQVSK